MRYQTHVGGTETLGPQTEMEEAGCPGSGVTRPVCETLVRRPDSREPPAAQPLDPQGSSLIRLWVERGGLGPTLRWARTSFPALGRPPVPGLEGAPTKKVHITACSLLPPAVGRSLDLMLGETTGLAQGWVTGEARLKLGPTEGSLG